MSEATVLDRVATVNGTARRPARKAKGERKPRGSQRRTMRAAKRLAAVCGSVATGVLALSVVHCTQAISSLTGSHWLLSALLAIGIDAGMVASEVAEVASHGTSAEQTVGPLGTRVHPRGYRPVDAAQRLCGRATRTDRGGATYAAAALRLIIPAAWCTAWGARRLISGARGVTPWPGPAPHCPGRPVLSPLFLPRFAPVRRLLPMTVDLDSDLADWLDEGADWTRRWRRGRHASAVPAPRSDRR